MPIVLSITFPLIYTSLFFLAVVFLLRTDNKKFHNKILFSVLTCGVAAWGWFNILGRSPLLFDSAVFCARAAFASALIAVIAFMLIALETVGIHFSLKKYWFLYLTFLVAVLSCFLPGFVMTGLLAQSLPIHFVNGFVEHIYIYEVLLFLVIGLIALAIAYKTGDIFIKFRMRPIILSVILTASIGITTNLILPFVFLNDDYGPIGPLASITIVAAMAYATIKWNFLGIYLKKSLSFSYYKKFWGSQGSELGENLRNIYILLQEKLKQDISALHVVVLPIGIITSKRIILFGYFISQFFILFLSLFTLISKRFISVEIDKQVEMIVWVTQKDPKRILNIPEKEIFLEYIRQFLFYKQAAEVSYTGFIKHNEPNNIV